MFWNSETAELTKCLRYYGLDLLPLILFAIIFLMDFWLNKSLCMRNQLSDYFRTYCFRFIANSILILVSIYKLLQSIGLFDTLSKTKDPELSELIILVNSLSLCSYVGFLFLIICSFKINF